MGNERTVEEVMRRIYNKRIHHVGYREEKHLRINRRSGPLDDCAQNVNGERTQWVLREMGILWNQGKGKMEGKNTTKRSSK